MLGCKEARFRCSHNVDDIRVLNFCEPALKIIIFNQKCGHTKLYINLMQQRVQA